MVLKTKILSIMIDNPAYVRKSERILVLCELLKLRDAKWSNAHDAHQHLQRCFYDNEMDHLNGNMPMTFPAFIVSSFHEKFNIYEWETDSHVMFINVNGAYGIYYRRSIPKNENKRSVYKEKNALIKISSLSGEDLWS